MPVYSGPGPVRPLILACRAALLLLVASGLPTAGYCAGPDPAPLTPRPALALGHNADEMISMKVLPDGERMVSLAENGTLCLWDLTTGHILHIFHLPFQEKARYGCLLSPDGEYLAGWLGDGETAQYVIWELTRFTEVARQADVHRLAFSPDAPEYFTVNSRMENVTIDGKDAEVAAYTIRRFSLADGVQLGAFDIRLDEEYKRIRQFAYSPDGKFLLTMYDWGELTSWTLAGKKLCEFTDIFVDDADTLLSTPSSPHLIICSNTEGAIVTCKTDGTLEFEDDLDILPDTVSINKYALSPDGTRLAVIHSQGKMRLLDLEDNRVLWEVGSGFFDRLTASLLLDSQAQSATQYTEVDFLPDGKQLLACENTGSLVLLNSTTGTTLNRWQFSHLAAFSSGVWTTSSQAIASAVRIGDMTHPLLWEYRTGSLRLATTSLYGMGGTAPHAVMADGSLQFISNDQLVGWHPQAQRVNYLSPPNRPGQIERRDFTADGRWMLQFTGTHLSITDLQNKTAAQTVPITLDQQGWEETVEDLQTMLEDMTEEDGEPFDIEQVMKQRQGLPICICYSTESNLFATLQADRHIYLRTLPDLRLTSTVSCDIDEDAIEKHMREYLKRKYDYELKEDDWPEWAGTGTDTSLSLMALSSPMVFARGGKELLVFLLDSSVRRFSTTDGQLLASIELSDPDTPLRIPVDAVMNAGEDRLFLYYVPVVVDPNSFTLSPISEIACFDLKTGRLLYRLDHLVSSADMPDGPLSLSPDGSRLIAPTKSGSLAIWDARTGKLLAQLLAYVRETPIFDANVSDAAQASKAWPSFIILTPEGYYDGSPGIDQDLESLVGTDAFPMECFKSFLHRPDCVRDALAGKGVPPVKLTGPLPPFADLHLLDLEDAAERGSLLMDLDLSDDCEVTRYEILINGTPRPVKQITMMPKPIDVLAKGPESAWFLRPAGHTVARVARLSLPLDNLPPQCKIQARAYDNDGLLSPLVQVEVTLPKRTAPRGKLYGLCVGVSLKGLQFADDDAEAIADLIRRQDAQYAGARAVTLTDAGATPEAIRAAFAKITADVQRTDTVIFFFSGHGARGATPSDFLLVTGDENREVGQMPWSEVCALLKTLSAKCGRIIVLLDACYSGRAGASEDLATELDKTSTGILIFASSKRYETSGELGADGKHGLFTHAILQVCTHPAGKESRPLPLRNFLYQVQEQVAQLSAQTQHPDYVNLERVDTWSPLLQTVPAKE